MPHSVETAAKAIQARALIGRSMTNRKLQPPAAFTAP
jgi:hypothetical protein